MVTSKPGLDKLFMLRSSEFRNLTSACTAPENCAGAEQHETWHTLETDAPIHTRTVLDTAGGRPISLLQR